MVACISNRNHCGDYSGYSILYNWREKRKNLEPEDLFLACEEGVHHVVYDVERAETVCCKCGLVLGDLQLDSGLDLVPLSRKRTSCCGKARRLRRSSKPPAFERDLRKLVSQMCPPAAVQSKALEICKAMRRQGFGRGYEASTLAKTAVYAAYRSSGITLALSEFASANAKERKSITRCYNQLCRKLELRVSRVESKDYLPYLAAKRKFPEEALVLADKMLDVARENGMARGANPIGIAAAALYISSAVIGHRVTQTELAKAAGISNVTVRSNCRVMQNLISENE